MAKKEEEVLVALSTLHPVAGRFDAVRSPQGVTAIVDYARGLSEVMMTRSLALAASFAMMGRLPLSRLPPAPTLAVQFIGKFNASNLLAVFGAAVLLGKKEEEVLVALSTLHPVAGRFDAVRSPQGVKHLFFFLAQQNGCPEYCQQIGSIELTDKLNCQLMVVEVEQHSF